MYRIRREVEREVKTRAANARWDKKEDPILEQARHILAMGQATRTPLTEDDVLMQWEKQNRR